MTHNNTQSSRGFSLIELVVTLTLMAVLSTLAFSKLKGYYDRASARSTSTSFDVAIRFARSEAQTRTNANAGTISMCALSITTESDGNTSAACNINNSDDWSKGWRVLLTTAAGTETLREFRSTGQITIKSGYFTYENDSIQFVSQAYDSSLIQFSSNAASATSGATTYSEPVFEFSYQKDETTEHAIAWVSLSGNGQASLTNIDLLNTIASN